MEDKEKPPLSDEELAAMRAHLKETEHKRWLGEIVKRWAQWIAAVALGVTVLWDSLGKIIKQLGGQ